VNRSRLQALWRALEDRPPEEAPATLPFIEIADATAGCERELLRRAGLEPPWALIADAVTWEVMGRRLHAALGGRSVVLEEQRPRADLATLARIEEAIGPGEQLVAVGAGTLNDLCKLAATRLGRRSAVFATAPSMNGWITATASIFAQGSKRSMPVRPPAGAIFDLEVLAAAPLRLIRAGAGDALCRPTVEMDAFLGHRLVGSPFRERWFEIQREAEEAFMASLAGMSRREREAIERLVVLLLTGSLAMWMAGSSLPASQGEHAIAHALDLLAAPDPPWFHGEAVAVATHSMAALQQEMLQRREPPRLCPVSPSHHPAPRAEATAPGSWPMLTDPAAVARLEAALAEAWPALRRRFRAAGRSAQACSELFARAAIPHRPRDLGIAEEDYERALFLAPFIRDRLSFLHISLLSEERSGHRACRP